MKNLGSYDILDTLGILFGKWKDVGVLATDGSSSLVGFLEIIPWYGVLLERHTARLKE